MLDLFGDGWGSANLLVYGSGGDYVIYGVTGADRVRRQYCFYPGVHYNGDYVILKITGFMPKFDWEVSINYLFTLLC